MLAFLRKIRKKLIDSGGTGNYITSINMLGKQGVRTPWNKFVLFEKGKEIRMGLVLCN